MSQIKPSVGILVEIGANIGYGNLIRCSNLANFFLNKEHQVYIFGNDSLKTYKNFFSEGAISFIYHSDGASEEIIQKKIDMCINKYNIKIFIADIFYESSRYKMDFLSLIGSPTVLTVALFDDSHKREIISNLVVNPNPAHVSSDVGLFGPEFFIAHDSINDLRKTYVIRQEIRNVFVSFGGVDPEGITVKVLKSLEKVDCRLNISIPITDYISNMGGIKLLKNHSKHNIKLINKKNNFDLLKIMFNSDIAFCAGGNTLYELAILGVPTITVSPLTRLDDIGKKFEFNNACVHPGLSKNLREKEIVESFSNLCKEYTKRKNLFVSSREYCR